MNSRESGISIRFPSRAVIHYLKITGSTTAQGSASRGTHEINNDGPGAIKTVENTIVEVDGDTFTMLSYESFKRPVFVWSAEWS